MQPYDEISVSRNQDYHLLYGPIYRVCHEVWQSPGQAKQRTGCHCVLDFPSPLNLTWNTEKSTKLKLNFIKKAN